MICRVEPDGTRTPLSKRVNVRRDFDRFFLFYFNHVLHVSLMHRRDILDRTGPYNENLTGLIDWDITRRLAFFTDFIHVPAVTAEYFAPHEPGDRISVQCRRDPVKYLRNVLTVRTARPAKPWPNVRDAAILVLRDSVDRELLTTLQEIRLWTFYPYCVYLAMPARELQRLPAIEALPIRTLPLELPGGTPERLAATLQACDAELAVTVPPRTKIGEMWVENALYALTRDPETPVAYRLEGAENAPNPPIAASWHTLRTALETRAPDLRHALSRAGVPLRTTEGLEHPFAFDERLSRARAFEKEGACAEAAGIYAEILERPENRLWMLEELSRVLFKLDRFDDARAICRRLNAQTPTVDSIFLEAKVEKGRGETRRSIELLQQAHALLGCNADETA